MLAPQSLDDLLAKSWIVVVQTRPTADQQPEYDGFARSAKDSRKHPQSHGTDLVAQPRAVNEDPAPSFRCRRVREQRKVMNHSHLWEKDEPFGIVFLRRVGNFNLRPADKIIKIRAEGADTMPQ